MNRTCLKLRGRWSVALGLAAGLGFSSSAAPGRPVSATSATAFTNAVFVVPNFHPACCGWLTDWSTERNYCGNSYLDHLDRVRDDPRYAFALSEVPNMIAMLNFHPDRAAELKQRVREGRVELVNAFFLEPTINLSGGEALVKMGVEGLRWQQAVLGVRPRFIWAIDVTGVHEQMAQIAAGLGLDALIYTRDNPVASTMHWFESPDGSRCLTLVPGHYSEWGSFFNARAPLDTNEVMKLVASAQAKAARTPPGAPVLVLGGGGDYSLAPANKEYPSGFFPVWQQAAPQSELRFTGLSAYLDAVLPGLKSGRIELPTVRSGARLSWTSFWIQCPTVKSWYRRAEHRLQSAEMLATLASLRGGYAYPAEALSQAWLQMLLNMDRNTLWGAAGGMVFEHDRSWDARDRFVSVDALSTNTASAALAQLADQGSAIALFNPLNWKRSDPVWLDVPSRPGLAGAVCQAEPGGRLSCAAELPSVGWATFAVAGAPAEEPKTVDLPPVIETAHYRAQIDPKIGALTSLRLKPSGRELLAGPVLLVAEQGGDGHNTPPRAQRARLADSAQFTPRLSVNRGPLATVVRGESTFHGGGRCQQIIRLYQEHPRIDFETELNDIPDKTVVVAEFPLAQPVRETRRGIPYGFSHGAWAEKNPALAGYADGIQAAIRWSHYQMAGAGVALLDRGLPGRELTGQTPVLFLLSAQETYLGYPCAWLSGRGRHRFSYALVAQEAEWPTARIPQMAWEFNCPPIVVSGAAPGGARSFMQTSANVIVEVLRRERDEIELRLAECRGIAGTAEVQLDLPHREAAMTDLTGSARSPLSGGPRYSFPVRPQQIVTLRFRADSSVPEVPPLVNWDSLVPPAKRAALNRKLPNRKGHPPLGDQPQLPADSARSVARGRPASASNVYQNNPDSAPEKAFDDNPQTRWASDAGLRQAWLAVDLGRARTVNRAYLSEAYDRVEEFALQAERDSRWETFARGGRIGPNLELTFPCVTARKFRLNVSRAIDGPTIWELELFEPEEQER